MQEYDAIIIGAGNGGLAAACALAQAGAKTLLLEKHNIAGGYATSFRRGRFEFEVSLHQLSGLGTREKPGPLRNILDSLGVTGEIDWVEMKNICRVIVPGILNIGIPADRARAVATLKQRFPGESGNIDQFFEIIYRCWTEFIDIYNYNFDSVDLNSKVDPGASPEKYPFFFKYAYMNLQRFLNSLIKDPLLQVALSVLSAYSGPPADISVIDLAIWIYLYIEYKPFHINGCSQALSNALMGKYLEYGGKVRFNCTARKIVVANGVARAVVAATGEEFGAKHIVADISPLTVYKEMIEPGKVPQDALDQLRGSEIGPSTFTVFVGLDCEASEIGLNDTNCFIVAPGQKPVMLACHDVAAPGCSAPGTTTLSLCIVQSHMSWMNVPPDRYQDRKYAVAERVLATAETVFPGFRSHIEEVEIGTPVTHMRYCGAPGGAIGGFKYYSRDYILSPVRLDYIGGLSFVGAFANNPGGYHPTLCHGWAVGHDIAAKLIPK